ncbi:hypothetical protein PTSG_13169 [Salpingoeca rosetta]|uniref:Thioesterase domain-containing protein n=1 Tax=Salpingoeca rosetta (strain ATCC 50818 / BSB-021) TaxID=946362 RepID=F2UT08_SALR5|nr:uncharacterized protein PTSG_13169 [Salpingoeca rosetta]EGD81267.1 hypothetical protein PTSG_13169 [Salpingoeca rosetta]|eukprot:XP_004987663.1 hypothetical protein PTSG_13169 [Salpingoeca rosetta]
MGDADERYNAWFPRTPPRECGLRVVCFHGAGCSDTVYTISRVAGKMAHNPLLAWQQDEENDVQVLGVQLPGRDQRHSVPPFTSINDIVDAFVADCGHLFNTPYVLVGHSVGSWIAHGVAKKLMAQGYEPPLQLFVSAFPPPTIPAAKRPWNSSRVMSDSELQAEARAWGVNPVVFQQHVWSTYAPLFRADFRLFDEQRPMSSADAWLGSVPIHVTGASHDTRIMPHLLNGWRKLSSHCSVDTVDGGHLFVFDAPARASWFDMIIKGVDALTISRLTPQVLLHDVISSIVNHGTAPSIDRLARAHSETAETITTALCSLPGVVVHPLLASVVEVQPFSLVPSSVCIRSHISDATWWAPTLFAALGAAGTALAEQPLLSITCSVGGAEQQASIVVRHGQLCGVDQVDSDDGGDGGGVGDGDGEESGIGSRSSRLDAHGDAVQSSDVSDLEAEIQRALRLHDQTTTASVALPSSSSAPLALSSSSSSSSFGARRNSSAVTGQHHIDERGAVHGARRRHSEQHAPAAFTSSSSALSSSSYPSSARGSGGRGCIELSAAQLDRCYVYFLVDPVPVIDEQGREQEMRAHTPMAQESAVHHVDVGYGTTLLLSNKVAHAWREQHHMPSGRILPLVSAFELAKRCFAFAAVHDPQTVGSSGW